MVKRDFSRYFFFEPQPQLNTSDLSILNLVNNPVEPLKGVKYQMCKPRKRVLRCKRVKPNRYPKSTRAHDPLPH